MNARWVALLSSLAVMPVLASPVVRVPLEVARQAQVAQLGNAPAQMTQLVLRMPDSLRVKMFAAVARGDFASAVALWEAQMGRKAPQWLKAFQEAFSAANQRAGPCVDVAKSISEGFKQLGATPSYMKFTAEGSRFLGFEMRAGEPRSTVQVSERWFHVVVQVKDRVYDAFTGPRGLPLTEYLQRLSTEPGATITRQVVESP
jgi:hypothetical protein